MQYSYQFDDDLQQEWAWTERYSPQPEILRYANHVADRYDLRRDIRFDTRVTAARFDEEAGLWRLQTDDGRHTASRFVVLATGCLSASNLPKIDGIDDFAGATYHTGLWPHEGVDFTGKRVAVIGTGSSAIQSIPEIARQAAHLTVFQRTPNYTVPANNAPLDPAYVARVKAEYPQMRARAKQMPPGIDLTVGGPSALAAAAAERRAEFERRWAYGGITFMAAFADLLVSQEANDLAAEFVREKIRATVKDPQVAALLSPDNVIGCKRLCVDTGYWATYNRPNVRLVDVSSEPIAAITRAGVRHAGAEYEVDAIVFATGFDAMTGAITRIDIRGRGGARLQDKWAAGPRAYLGVASAGFPNLFMITGPGSPSVLTNMLPSIEQHVEWITDAMAHLRTAGRATIDPVGAAEDAWVDHVNEVAGGSLRSTCSSWYVGANVPGKPRVFMPYIGGYPAYAAKIADVAAKGYDGFALY
jgi:cyclohexanone monooxygenase